MTTDQSFRIYTAHSLGEAIKHYRHEASLTQTQLAQRAELNRTYLSALEQGHETEHVNRLIRVLQELDVQIVLQKVIR